MYELHMIKINFTSVDRLFWFLLFLTDRNPPINSGQYFFAYVVQFGNFPGHREYHVAEILDPAMFLQRL